MAKNVQDVVMGMLSTAGEATRPPDPITADPTPSGSSRPGPLPSATSGARADGEPGRPPAPPKPPAQTAEVAEAPRTLRLRPKTAALLREAWVEAKHDDVFLTAQDFASNLLEEALGARRRRRTPRTA